MQSVEREVRSFIYQHFAAQGSAPSREEMAAGLNLPAQAVSAAIACLSAEHVLVLAGDQIRMAMPFSGVPTAFRVRSGRRAWFANCAWDALGIPAALGEPATIETHCADCDEALTLLAGPDRIEGDECIAHFLVPARRWWDDIGFT